LTQAVINGILGVQKALGSTVPPLNFILAGTVAAAAAANVSNIASASFQTGGVVQGQRSGDNVPILANGGERVLTARQNQAFEKFLSSAGGGSQITFEAPIINIQNGDPETVRRAVRETMEERIERFAEVQRDASVHEILA